MQKNSQDFSMEEALRMAQTPAGQQILAKLRQTDRAQLQKIADWAASGDMTKAASALNALLREPGA